MRTDDLDFELPAELIAQVPAPRRDGARLLHYNRADRSIEHRHFRDLPTLLRPGDLLVVNDSRVVPARFMLLKPTGGRVEGLFLEELSPGRWRVLLKNAGGISVGTSLGFVEGGTLAATIESPPSEGEHVLRISTSEPAEQVLGKVGQVPLPPYIRREKLGDAREPLDRDRYQTVYAKTPGSVAAPTAGLHFTDEVLESLASRGVERTAVTLHVSIGTFKPVTADNLNEHSMHSERYEITPDAAAALNRAKQDARRIVAVGTTACRVLESQPVDQEFSPHQGQTSILIRPPYAWKHVNALITNFHLPRSTLIALVAAFVGLEEQRRIYQWAIAKQYRFFSYGDCSLLE